MISLPLFPRTCVTPRFSPPENLHLLVAVLAFNSTSDFFQVLCYSKAFINMKVFKSVYSKETFGRLLADYAYTLFKLYRLKLISLAALVKFYNARSDYALYAIL